MSHEAHIKTVIALGFFDGVHTGHARLINTAKDRAALLNAEPAVLSFDQSPMEIVTGERVPLISSTQIREETIKRYFGVERVIIYHFDKAVMTMPWRQFISSLIADYNAAHFVIGHDFSCGFKGEGTAARIAEFCKEQGVGCDIIPEFKLDGITVSSTYIKSLIAAGDIENANRFLGHPYCISGTVEAGKKVGRKLGTPTINLHLDPSMLAPRFGVYATKVRFENGEEKNAVTNVGVNPTIGDGNKITVETFIMQFDGDLYGWNIDLDFYAFLRPERKFSSIDELKMQISDDTKMAQKVLSILHKST